MSSLLQYKRSRTNHNNMQFPQDNTDDVSMMNNDSDFQTIIISKLQSIDNKLTSLCAQHDLMKELINVNLKQSYNNSQLGTSTMEQQRPVYFKLMISKNMEGIPVRFRLSGRTYDIRDRIKEFGNPVWNKEFKCWDFDYNEYMYNNLVAYLSTLTTDITYSEHGV